GQTRSLLFYPGDVSARSFGCVLEKKGRQSLSRLDETGVPDFEAARKMSASTISIAGSVRWIGVGQSAQLLVQLIGVLVLARFVPPEDFGLLAMASTVVAFAALFRDMGTGAALIQRERLSTGLVNAVFW